MENVNLSKENVNFSNENVNLSTETQQNHWNKRKIKEANNNKKRSDKSK